MFIFILYKNHLYIGTPFIGTPLHVKIKVFESMRHYHQHKKPIQLWLSESYYHCHYNQHISKVWFAFSSVCEFVGLSVCNRRDYSRTIWSITNKLGSNVYACYEYMPIIFKVKSQTTRSRGQIEGQIWKFINIWVRAWIKSRLVCGPHCPM